MAQVGAWRRPSSAETVKDECSSLREQSKQVTDSALRSNAWAWLERVLGQPLPTYITLEELLANGWILGRLAEIVSALKDGKPARLSGYLPGQLGDRPFKDKLADVERYHRLFDELRIQRDNLVSPAQLASERSTLTVCRSFADLQLALAALGVQGVPDFGSCIPKNSMSRQNSLKKAAKFEATGQPGRPASKKAPLRSATLTGGRRDSRGDGWAAAPSAASSAKTLSLGGWLADGGEEAALRGEDGSDADVSSPWSIPTAHWGEQGGGGVDLPLDGELKASPFMEPCSAGELGPSAQHQQPAAVGQKGELEEEEGMGSSPAKTVSLGRWLPADEGQAGGASPGAAVEQCTASSSPRPEVAVAGEFSCLSDISALSSPGPSTAAPSPAAAAGGMYEEGGQAGGAMGLAWEDSQASSAVSDTPRSSSPVRSRITPRSLMSLARDNSAYSPNAGSQLPLTPPSVTQPPNPPGADATPAPVAGTGPAGPGMWVAVPSSAGPAPLDFNLSPPSTGGGDNPSPGGGMDFVSVLARQEKPAHHDFMNSILFSATPPPATKQAAWCQQAAGTSPGGEVSGAGTQSPAAAAPASEQDNSPPRLSPLAPIQPQPTPTLRMARPRSARQIIEAIRMRDAEESAAAAAAASTGTRGGARRRGGWGKVLLWLVAAAAVGGGVAAGVPHARRLQQQWQQGRKGRKSEEQPAVPRDVRHAQPVPAIRRRPTWDSPRAFGSLSQG